MPSTLFHLRPARRGHKPAAITLALVLLVCGGSAWPPAKVAIAASALLTAQTKPAAPPAPAQTEVQTRSPIRVLRGHAGAVTSVAVAADGRKALSGSFDKTLKYWDLTSGKVIRTLSGHGDKVLAVALAPDGRSALSGSTDNVVRAWSLDTGQNTLTVGERIADAYAPIHALAFSPDGGLAVSGTNVNTLQLWNPATGGAIRTLGEPAKGRFSPIYAVAFTPDGRSALSGSRDNTLRLWDINSGKVLRTLKGHTADVTSVAVAADGKTALSGSWDETLRLWNLANGETIRTLRDPGLDLHAVALAPDGRRAITGGKDNALKLWDLDAGAITQSLAGHAKPVRSAAFTPDGRYAVSAGDDGVLMIWDLAPAEPPPVVPVAAAPPSPDKTATDAPATVQTAPPAPPVGYIQPQEADAPAVKAPPKQREEYLANVRKTVLELQQFRASTDIGFEGADGRKGSATLINLNPAINGWFLLKLKEAGKQERNYHLENPDPQGQRILLEGERSDGPLILAKGKRLPCPLWSGTPKTALENAAESGLAFAPLCDGRLLLRNQVEGRKTSKEWTTDLLRTYVPGGEQITTLVKESIYQDAYLDTSELTDRGSASDAKGGAAIGAPQPGLIQPRYAETFLSPQGLAITPLTADPRKLRPGQWYPAKDLPGMWISVIQPQLVAEEVIQSQQGRVKALEATESAALVYLVAFDLKAFDLGFAMGTEHPRLDWSDRIPAKVRDTSLPGPDGIGAATPLVNTGLVNPIHANRIAATFVGGFRRYHGAFKGGDLAGVNHGSHYGFIEQGVVLSKLAPGLATLLVEQNGAVEIKTWRAEDEASLARIRYARQNGVPIIDFDPEGERSFVGEYVPLPTGSWSGSAEGNERTLRAGLAIQESPAGRFLIYGYFSAATPSAMARVFQAYRSKYAMLLDMNAPEHTYMAAYLREGGELKTQHLTKAMAALDRSSNGKTASRFIGYADNRDFFYLLRKTAR